MTAPPEISTILHLNISTVLIALDSVGYSMSSVLEVKMINEGDNVRIVVPKSYFEQLGVARGDTLLVTIEEERARDQKKRGKAHARRQRRHN
jgi:hypothetical protein